MLPEKSDRRASLLSAPAHEVDDLERIVSCELQHRKGRAVTQNGSVALDDDSTRVEAQRSQKIRQGPTRWNTTLCAVHGEYDLTDYGFRHNCARPRHTCER